MTLIQEFDLALLKMCIPEIVSM